MNPHMPQPAYSAPFIPGSPHGVPLLQYPYGSAYAASQPQIQQQDARPSNTAPFGPPLIVPIYPIGLHPFGYPGVFTPNYAMYPAPSPVSTPTPTSPRPHPTPYIRDPSHASNERPQSRAPPPPPPAPPPPPQWMSSPTSSRSGTPSHHSTSRSSRTTGRYGINELLNCHLDRHPYIDWVIYNDLSLARQWVKGTSGTERCQAVVFDSLAVLPPVNNLCIRGTNTGLQTPVGQAIERWGVIRVCRFDRFLSVGDVLHEIWAYFHAPLTEEEKGTMHPPFASRVEECFQKRWNAQGRVPEQAVKRRCDTLLNCGRFAGLEIGLDFETCRELYLSFADAG